MTFYPVFIPNIQFLSGICFCIVFLVLNNQLITLYKIEADSSLSATGLDFEAGVCMTLFSAEIILKICYIYAVG